MAATFTNPAGTAARSMGFGVGGAIGSVIADRAGQQREASHGDAHRAGMAGDLPSKPLVLALTDERLLVYGFAQMSGGPKELITEYPLGDLAGVSLEKLKLVYRLIISFTDGSILDLDARRAAGAPDFAAAAGQLIGR